MAEALDTIEDIEDELDLLPKNGESRKKLVKAVREFRGYIEANQTLFRTMGSLQARREDFNGLREVGGEPVVSKRMVKSSKCDGPSPARTIYFRRGRRCSMTNSGKPSFAGIRGSTTDRNSEECRIAPGLKCSPIRWC